MQPKAPSPQPSPRTGSGGRVRGHRRRTWEVPAPSTVTVPHGGTGGLPAAEPQDPTLRSNLILGTACRLCPQVTDGDTEAQQATPSPRSSSRPLGAHTVPWAAGPPFPQGHDATGPHTVAADKCEEATFMQRWTKPLSRGTCQDVSKKQNNGTIRRGNGRFQNPGQHSEGRTRTNYARHSLLLLSSHQDLKTNQMTRPWWCYIFKLVSV